MKLDFAKFLSEVFKLIPFFFISLCLICAVVLFLPEFINDQIGLSGLVNKNKQWFGLVLLVSATITISQFISYIRKIIVKKVNQKKITKVRKEYLKDLSEEEKEILNYYFDNNVRTQQISYSSGITRGLEFHKVIYRSSEVASGYNMLIPYTIQPWAWKYLKRNLQFIRQ